MKKILLRQIAAHLGVVCDSDLQISGYQIDSRFIQEGDLFFALKGMRSDGHGFLQEVKERGAVGAVVSKGYEGSDFGLVLCKVEDVLGSLQELARYFLEKNPVQIIAITGSVGKTTTKEFIATILEGKFRVGKNFSSYNTKLTLPLTLLNRSGDEEVLILEMGMSEPGDIQRLVEIAPPDIALITKIALSHAALFPGGLKEIAKEKGAIFSHPKTKTAVFDHGFYEYAAEIEKIKSKKVSFSLLERSADYFLTIHEERLIVDERGVRVYQFDIPFRQPHLLHNFLGAISIARQMKMEWDEINRQIGKLELPKMRFEQFEKRGIYFVNDTYNANPDSMRAALSSLPEPKEGGKRIAVLGTMKELGVFSESAHREIGQFAQKYIDYLLVLGEEARPICEGFTEVKRPGEVFFDHKSLAERLAKLMSLGDVVLIKGSRSMKMETLFELLD